MPRVRSRERARKLGLSRYKTGRACKRGHIAERYTKSAHCVECSREQAKRWYADHPEWFQRYHIDHIEERHERTRRWQAENPERHCANVKRWNAKNPEKLRDYKRRRRADMKNASGAETPEA